MKTPAAVLALSIGALPAFLPAAPRPSIESVLSALQRVQEYDATAVSPDGKRVAWVHKLPNASGALKLAEIETASLSAPAEKPRRVTAGRDGRNFDERSPAWSPDSRSLAFRSDAAGSGQAQVWVAPAAGGPPRQITHVRGQISNLLWSPDGRSIAFLFVEGSSQETGALTAYKPDSGPVLETIEEQRIAVADVATGRVRPVSPANLYVYDYDWSPDGRTFAAEAAEGSGTNNYWIAQLYTVDAASGRTKSIWKPPLQIACPRWSPDGREIAVIHGLMSDEA